MNLTVFIVQNAHVNQFSRRVQNEKNVFRWLWAYQRRATGWAECSKTLFDGDVIAPHTALLHIVLIVLASLYAIYIRAGNNLPSQSPNKPRLIGLNYNCRSWKRRPIQPPEMKLVSATRARFTYSLSCILLDKTVTGKILKVLHKTHT